MYSAQLIICTKYLIFKITENLYFPILPSVSFSCCCNNFKLCLNFNDGFYYKKAHVRIERTLIHEQINKWMNLPRLKERLDKSEF